MRRVVRACRYGCWHVRAWIYSGYVAVIARRATRACACFLLHASPRTNVVDPDQALSVARPQM